MMARLIDVDEAVINFGFEWDDIPPTREEFVYFLKKQPTINAVPVVRCKDCKYYKPQKKSAHWENRTNYCNRVVTIKAQPDDFCSYGERKDGDDE